MLAVAEAAAAGTERGRRAPAIVRPLHDLALRRAGLAGLDVADFEAGDDRMPSAIWIPGKGRPARERISLPAPTARAQASRLETRGPAPGRLLFRLDRVVGPA